MFTGVINLSSINFKERCCDIALVLKKNSNILIPLEAIALMTSHAFEKLDLERIAAEQSEELYRWQNVMELCGYKIEGLPQKAFAKSYNKKNCVTIACSKEDYINICRKRGGVLWDSKEKMLKRIKKLPKNNFFKIIKYFFNKERKKYYEKIFSL